MCIGSLKLNGGVGWAIEICPSSQCKNQYLVLARQEEFVLVVSRLIADLSGSAGTIFHSSFRLVKWLSPQ